MALRPVPLDGLRAELDEWMRRLDVAAECWLTARAAGLDTDQSERAIREAQEHTRRLERRIARRKS
jgi:hypothetical protein